MRVFILYPLILTLSIVAATPTGHVSADINVHINDAITEGSGVSLDAITATPWPPFLDLSRIFEGMHDKGDPPSILDLTTRDLASLPDFWETVKKSEKTLQDYVERLLEGAAAYFQSAEFLVVMSTMNDIVATTASFRDSISSTLDAHNITLDMFTQELENIFMQISEDLGTIPSPTEAPGHAKRVDMVNKILDDTGRGFVKLAAQHGIEEHAVATYLSNLGPQASALIDAVGAINEQCPSLFPALAFSIVILLVPEMWILRPFLSLFGFGPAGPIMGSTAAFLQSRFWGAAVAPKSWFSFLQAAGMGKMPNWTWFVTDLPLLVGSLGVGLLSCFKLA